jgi:hypothetical protein
MDADDLINNLLGAKLSEELAWLAENDYNDEALMEGKAPRRRWYDPMPELAHAAEWLQLLPKGQQRLMATLILERVDLRAMAYPNEARLKNLGTERILGLMRTKYKRRWYDKDPLVHRAFICLLLVHDHYRKDFGRRMCHALQTIQDFSDNCLQQAVPIDFRAMRTLALKQFRQERVAPFQLPERPLVEVFPSLASIEDTPSLLPAAKPKTTGKTLAPTSGKPPAALATSPLPSAEPDQTTASTPTPADKAASNEANKRILSTQAGMRVKADLNRLAQSAAPKPLPSAPSPEPKAPPASHASSTSSSSPDTPSPP